VRRVSRTTRTTRNRPAARTKRRLPGGWLAAALIMGAVALLVPGVRYVTASQSTPATLTSAALTTSTAGCRGVTPAVFPAVGFITDANRSEGGHLWWRQTDGGICIGTVVERVQYNTTATKTWRVIVYTAQDPNGQVVAEQTFTLGQGWYFWNFGVHQVFSGLSAVCITADESFGTSCIHFN
jgi:hypothetical protein